MAFTSKLITAVIVLALLLSVCGAQAAETETTAQHENVLLLLCDGSYVIGPLILTFDWEKGTVRIIHFCYQAQINAVTKKGEAMDMPITFLLYCEPDEIVKAFETACGIPIEKYIIFDYSAYQSVIDAFEALGPVTLEVPSEMMGDEEYSSVNGNMRVFANAVNAVYAPLKQAGVQALDELAFLSYIATTPDRIWESGDRFTMMMADYQYQVWKMQAMIEAFRPVISRLDPATALAFMQQVIDQQETDVTREEIAAIAGIAVNFPEGAPYLTVPGFENVGIADFDAGALTGIPGYDAKMLTYDMDAMAASLQAFIHGR